MTLTPRSYALSIVSCLCLSACQYLSSPAPFEPFSRDMEREAPPLDVFSLRFSERLTPVDDYTLYRPEEVAGVGVSPDQRQLYVGIRTGKLLCLRAKDGTLRWEVETDGSITTTPAQPATSELVYFASDDGNIYAVQTRDGALRWKQQTKSAAERELVFASGLVIARLNDGSVLALDQDTGETRWTWRHPLPDGFTIEGSSALRVTRNNRILVGTADGYLFALHAADGRKAWSTDLGAGGDSFVDVDATPVVSQNVAYAASYSGGVYALSMEGGVVLWRQAISGVVGLARSEEGFLYAVSAEQRLYALSEKTGEVIYNVPLPVDAYGVLVSGPYLLIWTRADGIWAVERANGRLAQRYNTGNGVRARPTVAGPSLYILSNGGRLYAFDLVNEFKEEE